MRFLFVVPVSVILAFTSVAVAVASGSYWEVNYSPSAESGGLQLGVAYTIWLPNSATRIRGIIVHQHGCGIGACRGGATAAYDLHWHALAKKWDCALLGPSYHQNEKQNCRLWCDPRNGSDGTFLRAIDDLAKKANHPELATVPWCLWGHSGGGFWASLMQTLHPERIVAIWFQSGTAFSAWENGEVPKPDISAAALAIPMMCNPGVKEKTHERFNRAWTGCLGMFEAYRAKGAPIGFAPDPRTAHECGDSRYLAIPFFDACLAMRLPPEKTNSATLRPVNRDVAWLATPLTDKAVPAPSYSGPVDQAVWLPNERVAKSWAEFVRTGAVSDTTPPPHPFNVKAKRLPNGTIEITWNAEADFESGIKAFVVQRETTTIGQIPQKPTSRFGRPLFQRMSYGDTPETPLSEMRFLDTSAPSGTTLTYRVITVNSVDLKSPPSQPATVP